MKRIYYTLFIVSSCLAQSSYAQDHSDIKKLCDKLENKYSIKLYFEEFPATSWKIDYALATRKDYKKLHRYILIFDNEFSKYPKSFLKRTKLSAVVFVKSLAFQKQLRTAIPDYGKEILILDFIRGGYAPIYQKHVIHHEFYHMIEEEFNKSAYWKDPGWAKLNGPKVQYGRGGKTVQKNSKAYLFTHPEKGFVNLYSKSAIEEDKAEIYAALFLKEEYKKLIKWAKKDKSLYKKTKYMKSFLRKLDPKFTEKYWLKLHTKGNKPSVGSGKRKHRSHTRPSAAPPVKATAPGLSCLQTRSTHSGVTQDDPS